MGKTDYRRKAVLVVECDSAKLAQQNLALGEQLCSLIKQAFPLNPVDLVQSDTEAGLLEKVRELHEKGRPYRSIIVVGHSNQDGLMISSDRFIGWGGVANWFKSFDPHRIILIACNAGRWLPCTALFSGMPTLKEIFGSPAPAHKDQAFAVLFIVLHILGAQKADADTLRLIQAGNFLLTKGLMLRRSRREYEESGVVEGLVWGLTDSVLNQLAERLRR